MSDEPQVSHVKLRDIDPRYKVSDPSKPPEQPTPQPERWSCMPGVPLTNAEAARLGSDLLDRLTNLTATLQTHASGCAEALAFAADWCDSGSVSETDPLAAAALQLAARRMRQEVSRHGKVEEEDKDRADACPHSE